MNQFQVPPGIYLQLYRGKMRDRAELLHHLDACKKLVEERVIAGVLPHGFPRDFERNASSIASECRARSLPFAFAWGLDGARDDDKTRLTAKEKGSAIGDVCAAIPDLVFGALNNESQWDSDTGPDDDMDEQGALDMGAKIRERAPDVVLCNQPWPAILQHGDIRPRALPIDKGGPFKGFPIDEMATYVQWFADQRYWENWHRKDRYRYLNAWAEQEWALVDAALAKAGLQRPRTLTIQGYHHDEQPWTVVDAVLSRRDRPVIVWCEPFPDLTTLRCLHGAAELVRRGFVRDGESHRDGIKRFQRDAHIVEDGWLGDEGLRALGL